MLNNRIKAQFKEMLQHSNLFFDRNKLHPHYTYSFLKGLKNNLVIDKKLDYQPLFKLLNSIRESNRQTPFIQDDQKPAQKDAFYSTWTANWRSVHQIIAELLDKLITTQHNQPNQPIFDFDNIRNDLLAIIQYLLHYPDPSPEDEKPDTAKHRIKKPQEEEKISNPFTIALNSVRGQAYEAFLHFIYLDGEKLSSDVKNFYQDLVGKEKTRAMMFMYGRFLPTFYFRDKKWAKKHLIQPLFRNQDYLLNLAATEGFLSQNIFKAMFEDKVFQELYSDWIDLEDTNYPNQDHFKDIDKALADHLALAFIFFDFDLGHLLMDEFWSKYHAKRHHEFIRFTGRVITRKDNNPMNKKLAKKLLNFWGWALEANLTPKVLSAFGHWISKDNSALPDKAIVTHIARTLEKSSGLWEMDHRLMEKIVDFSQASPRKTLYIIRHFFLSIKDKDLRQRRTWGLYRTDNLVQVLKTIQKHDPSEVEQLINDLNEQIGGQPFWELEEKVLGVKSCY